MYKTLFLLVLAIVSCKALTDEEMALFFNDGCGGGSVSVERTNNNNNILFRTMGIPDHKWQLCNPNPVRPQEHEIVLPNEPTIAEHPFCLGVGPIGWAFNGVAIYNPFAIGQDDIPWVNAVDGGTEETFDVCDGHPTPQNEYHYHRLPMSCVYFEGTQQEQFIGVAKDGFAIYGPYQADLGRDAVNADLDECHGRIVSGTYRYVFLRRGEENFPYVMGCFRGEPARSSSGPQPPRLSCETCSSGESPCNARGQVCLCIADSGMVEVDLLSYGETTSDEEPNIRQCGTDEASLTCRDPHDQTPDSLDLEVLKTLDAK